MDQLHIFDSHCHLDDKAFDEDLETVIQRAHQADVAAMMIVGVDGASSRQAVAIAKHHDNVWASVGMHPHDAKACGEPLMDEMRRLAAHPKVVAWGETGLDFNRMLSPQGIQEHWFARQLEMAADLDLPMVFHERDSQGRFLEILESHWNGQRTGVVHCFSGTPAELEAYLRLDLYIGITGIVTIKTRGQALREMVPQIPLNRLLVETDAPYLTPTPERNKFRRNEPAFVRTVLFKLAEVLETDPGELARITWDNTRRLLFKDQPHQ